jgi:hypothetical protein
MRRRERPQNALDRWWERGMGWVIGTNIAIALKVDDIGEIVWARWG